MNAENIYSRRFGLLKGKIRSAAGLYLHGLQSMKLGRTLWKIILIKLIVIFAVFKLFLFPDVMEDRFENDAQRASHVMDIITGQHSD